MTPIFPASYSTLSPYALSSLISEKYELENVRCKLLTRGVGDTYLIESSASNFIVRVYRSSHRNLLQIREEIELLLSLRKEQVPVSYPISDKSGEVIMELNAVEGTRYAVVFSYASGELVRILSQKQLQSLGHEMARFHLVSAKMSNGNSRWNFDTNTTLLEPLQILKPAFAKDPEGYQWLEAIVNTAEQRISTTETEAFAKGYCHFDFLPKNFHFQDDTITFFDFDFMGYGLLVNDIMTFWQHLILDVFTGRMTREAADEAYEIFLNAYQEFRPISQQELALVPYLAIGFWLFYMRFHTTHDQFYAFSQPEHVKGYLRVLKYIVDKHWDQIQ